MSEHSPLRSPLTRSREHIGNNALTVLSVALWVVVISYAYTQAIPRAQYGVLFLGGGILVYLVSELLALEDGAYLDLLLLGVSGIVSVVTTAYVYVNYDVLSTIRTGYALPHEYSLAAVFTVVILYLTYRAFGRAFLAVIVLALIYAAFGYLFPGLLKHGGFSLDRIVNLLVLEYDGFFGSITQIVAAWVALFLLYAGLLRAFGAFDIIMRIAFRAATFVKSGVAQSAVISSLIIGSINGAQTANAAMTGSFTIPLMKRSGMKSETAGGIEAVASSGGQIMPPVMGAAAFVMASLLGITYIQVVIAGIIPALIFFVSVSIGVHYMSVRQLTAADLDIESQIDELNEGFHPLVEAARFGIPFAVLMYALGIAQFTVMTSALITCVTMVLTGGGIPIALSIFREQESVGETVKENAAATIRGLRYGAISIAPIAIIIAAVNGIVDLLMATGMPSKFSLALIGISGGVMAIGVVMAMIICIILGLGMPTVAAYTIVALLIAPTLVSDFGVPNLAAHYFVFYSAILSGITPPIAIAVVVVTGIAESNFWKTSLEALKLSTPLFVLPFAFIYNPELVLGGFTPETIVSGTLAILGAIAITHGLNYYERPLSSRAIGLVTRAVFLVLGVGAMVYPNVMVRVGLVATAIVLYLVQLRVPSTTIGQANAVAEKQH
ncbi:TRAP transporter permease [Haladaptatus sp. CMSO5]|uniref:TRAP transporter permease n=1 Tax=Haladaptatus sp. CMSO5 TaxID=3120514 RepID=UPI002FCE066B